jgi:hypothetical protein
MQIVVSVSGTMISESRMATATSNPVAESPRRGTYRKLYKEGLDTFKHQIAQVDPFPRARECYKAPPPGMKIYPRRGWITFFELRHSSPPGAPRPDDLPPIRPAKGAVCRAPKKTTNSCRHLRSVIPGGKTKFFPGGKAFPGEAGNDFLIEGAGDARERFWTGATANSARTAQCWDGTTSPDIGAVVPIKTVSHCPNSGSHQFRKSPAENQQEPTGPTRVKS